MSAETFIHPGVWCCEHRSQCKWQGFALHQGLGWGELPDETNDWRKYHAFHCGGKLIQLAVPNTSVEVGEAAEEQARIKRNLLWFNKFYCKSPDTFHTFVRYDKEIYVNNRSARGIFWHYYQCQNCEMFLVDLKTLGEEGFAIGNFTAG